MFLTKIARHDPSTTKHHHQNINSAELPAAAIKLQQLLTKAWDWDSLFYDDNMAWFLNNNNININIACFASAVLLLCRLFYKNYLCVSYLPHLYKKTLRNFAMSLKVIKKLTFFTVAMPYILYNNIKIYVMHTYIWYNVCLMGTQQF